MLDRFRSFIIGLSLLVIMALMAMYFIVAVGSGEEIFGDKDGTLPKVDFATLIYSPDFTGYLACDADRCPNSVADSPPPVFEIGAPALRQFLVDFADARPTVDVFRFDLPANQFDFTERLPGQTFPAVITVKIISIDAYRSTALLYSRQPVGDSDKQDHSDRVVRWLAMIRNQL